MAMRNNAGDNKNVNKTFGPIADSAKPKAKPYKGDTKKPAPYKGDTKKPAPYKGDTKKSKPKQDITKIPGFKFGRGTE